MTEQHVEETPEMARLRKAKAALKGSQSHIAEVVAANDDMSSRMKSVASELERYAKEIGGGVSLHGYFSAGKNPGNTQTLSIKHLLEHEARRLRECAV